MNYLERLQTAIAPLQQELATHALYQTLSSVADIRVFMEYHVFAVWDFMSLLKALQQRLTGTTLPWMPTEHPTLARFINEIVWGEESDVNELGEPKSHFVMYLDAMEQTGANQQPIQDFLGNLNAGQSVAEALNGVVLPSAVVEFVRFTFSIIETGEAHLVASAFTFGREDLIPDLFLAIIKEAQANSGRDEYSKLTYYLQRHIDVDGDEHGPLALQMMGELCKDDPEKWEAATAVAVQALEKRLALWQGIQVQIQERGSC